MVASAGRHYGGNPKHCSLRWISSNWRWVVAVAAFWLNFCILGVMRSSAVIFVALLENFGVSREDAAWPLGIFGFCMCITGVLSGYVSHYFSNRSIMMVGALTASVAVSLTSCARTIEHVTALYGAFQGAGVGVIVPLTHVTLNQYFSSHRALAMGIAYSGSSVGSFLFPPLAHWMLEEFGLSGTFILLGGIMLNSLPAIALMRNPEVTSEQEAKAVVGDEETPKASPRAPATGGSSQLSSKADDRGVKNQPKDVTKCSNTSDHLRKLRASIKLTVDVLSDANFLVISAAYAIYFSVSAIYLMIILDFAHETGIPKKRSVYLVSAFSFGDLAGRLACGWLADLRCVRRKSIVSCYLIAMGGLVIAVPWCYNFELLTVSSVLLGVLNGSVIVNFSAMLAESMGLAKLPLAVGFSSFIIGVTAFLRPIVIGLFRDQHQSYDFLFVSMGATQILVTVPLVAQDFLRRISTRSRRTCAVCVRRTCTMLSCSGTDDGTGGG